MFFYSKWSTIIRLSIISCLALHLLSYDATAKVRHDEHPPGAHATEIPWIQLPGADPFTILFNNRAVQAELRLTEGQKIELKRMEKLFRSELNELSNVEDKKQARTQIKSHIKIARDGLARVLSGDQIRRLQEILLRINGPCSLLSDRDIAGPINLLPEQKTKMEKICSNFNNSTRDVHASLPQGRDKPNTDTCAGVKKNRKKMLQNMKSTSKKCVDLLSGEQKIIYLKMLGEPFEINWNDRMDCQ